ncbi:hypothetical protein B0H17DRAFT_1110416 [Mycena rosella]|uniref:Uncharacterized protein n=1 Tax=Mycena rosella TaxID=1033263 RepID=A0AAD7BR11_MYCRO|nr:hypothetical protein B0H17DRAFT_1110416 [Mycena rosella]
MHSLHGRVFFISKTTFLSLTSLASWARRQRRQRHILGQDTASFQSRFPFLFKDASVTPRPPKTSAKPHLKIVMILQGPLKMRVKNK